MYTKIISTILLLIKITDCHFLEAEANYQKPKLERNNIVNKGVWMRNKQKENLFEKGRVGDFIFRENSLDVDSLLQNNFDAFGANYMQDSPLISAYIKRTKRATRVARENRPRKSIIKNCNGKGCKTHNLEDREAPDVDILNPNPAPAVGASVFNDYPYEVAILLNNNKSVSLRNDTHLLENEIDKSNYNVSKNESERLDGENYTNQTPKRSMKYDFETEIIKKFEFTEDMNKTQEVKERNESKLTDRNIFDKDNTVWHQNAPIPDVNVYKVVPKEPQKSKPVTERGLIKVISMLTKTFKKIMKQHNEIKDIHGRISDINDDFIKNTASLTNKFQDFDLKYMYLLKFHEKLKSFDAKLASKQEYFKSKEREMARNFKEFENQQKKFLQQQRQFYNIQKLMLVQNEKINLKQNLIAKTQSEISHRQNNFARILKKAKQLYVESKNPGITKLSSSLSKMNQNLKSDPKVTHTSTISPTTESVKINLFSIPISNKLEDQDDMIIKEKDDQNIDDLVYKYYFNNTFIDNLMKNNILTSVMGASDSTSNPRNVKNKRNELETTILLPIVQSNDSEAFVSKNRERRWINHHSRRKSKRRDRGKEATATVIEATDSKILKNVVNNVPVSESPKPQETKDIKLKNDPFLTMATNFCIEIRQNINQQMLRWCVEKALRRLKFLDIKSMPTLEISTTAFPVNPNNLPYKTMLPSKNTGNQQFVTMPETVKVETSPSVKNTPSIVTDITSPSTPLLPSNQSTPKEAVGALTLPGKALAEGPAFFPDNEELESNLRQFDIRPDLEGNVYYEGSIHASEIIDSESTGIDDIMPGLESNSRVEMDPLAFDLQAKRRAFVRKLNEKIKKSLG